MNVFTKIESNTTSHALNPRENFPCGGQNTFRTRDLREALIDRLINRICKSGKMLHFIYIII